jgi:glycosyltransferase involved in cell wall biosynthesis
MTRSSDSDALLVVEPTYRGPDHAPLNAAVLAAARVAFPDRPLIFAASDIHHAAVAPLLGRDMPPRFFPIEVLAPVGSHGRRFLAQFNGTRRAIAASGARTALLLSSGPETFFAARALVTLNRRLSLFVMLHGNAGLLLERRTRDPLFRAFDYTAGFHATRHARIRTIVLEAHIAALLAQTFPGHPRSLVWPHPVAPHEIREHAPCERGEAAALRIGFVGAASRGKGFDHFLAAARRFQGRGLDFRLAGYLTAEFRPDEVPWHGASTQPLPRATFLDAIRALDFAFLPFSPDVYEFTASGSLLDCIANLVPVIATRSTLLQRLSEQYGPIGHVCATQEETFALLAEPARLAQPGQLATFRANLAKIRADRLPEALARLMRRDLGGA